jgi:polyisoprenoid-binding protein YceI
MKRLAYIFTAMTIALLNNTAIAGEGNNEYKVNTSESKINWLGTKPGGEHYGIVKISNGTLNIEDGELKGGNFVIDLRSIENLDIESEAWNKKLVDHLKSEDFFYVDKYPTGVFTITEVEKNTSELYRLTGNLELRGITKTIRFNANVAFENEILKAKTPKLVLDRTQWKIEAMSKTVFTDLKDKYVDDEMQIEIELVAEKE